LSSSFIARLQAKAASRAEQRLPEVAHFGDSLRHVVDAKVFQGGAGFQFVPRSGNAS